jgi:hypothetical protein
MRVYVIAALWWLAVFLQEILREVWWNLSGLAQDLVNVVHDYALAWVVEIDKASARRQEQEGRRSAESQEGNGSE